MPRPKLNLTPEQRAERVRVLAMLRKQKQRDRDARRSIAVLLSLGVAAASMALAIWEKEYRQKLPQPERPEYRTGEGQAAFEERWDRWKRFQTIRYMALNAIARDKGRARKKRYDNNDAAKAATAGVTIEVFRKEKRAARLTKKFLEIAASTHSTESRITEC